MALVQIGGKQRIESVSVSISDATSNPFSDEYAMRMRLKHSAMMDQSFQNDNTRWPNDEGFFASAVYSGGFRVRDFNEITPVHSMATFRFDPPFLNDDFIKLETDELIYHPVLEFEAYMAKLVRNPAFARDRAKVEPEALRLAALGFPQDRITSVLREHLPL